MGEVREGGGQKGKKKKKEKKKQLWMTLTLWCHYLELKQGGMLPKMPIAKPSAMDGCQAHDQDFVPPKTKRIRMRKGRVQFREGKPRKRKPAKDSKKESLFGSLFFFFLSFFFKVYFNIFLWL